jgi:small subunit ribosomal protein S6
MNTYEATFILRPEDEFLSAGKEFLKELFTKENCKLLKEEDMGNRQLAYEIKKSDRGHYLFYELEADPQSIASLDKALKLRNEILKYLFLRKEE